MATQFVDPDTIVNAAAAAGEQPEHDRRHSKAMDQVIQNARTATEKEHKMTLLQGIKLYPKAIAWSMLISTCIVMEGYDVCLINNFCTSNATLSRYSGCSNSVKGLGTLILMMPTQTVLSSST